MQALQIKETTYDETITRYRNLWRNEITKTNKRMLNERSFEFTQVQGWLRNSNLEFSKPLSTVLALWISVVFRFKNSDTHSAKKLFFFILCIFKQLYVAFPHENSSQYAEYMVENISSTIFVPVFYFCFNFSHFFDTSYLGAVHILRLPPRGTAKRDGPIKFGEFRSFQS